MGIPSLPASVVIAGTRLGPYLGRLAKQVPSLPVRMAAKIRTAGGDITDVTPKDKNWIPVITTWIKTSPMNAFTAVATLAGLGHPISALFSGSDDAESVAIVKSLEVTTTRAVEMLKTKATELIEAAGHASETLPGLAPNGPSAMNVEATREVLAWASIWFGTKEEAQLTHKYMQAFFEMPREHVIYGYENLRLSPPAATTRWKFLP